MVSYSIYQREVSVFCTLRTIHLLSISFRLDLTVIWKVNVSQNACLMVLLLPCCTRIFYALPFLQRLSWCLAPLFPWLWSADWARGRFPQLGLRPSQNLFWWQCPCPSTSVPLLLSHRQKVLENRKKPALIPGRRFCWICFLPFSFPSQVFCFPAQWYVLWELQMITF